MRDTDLSSPIDIEDERFCKQRDLMIWALIHQTVAENQRDAEINRLIQTPVSENLTPDFKLLPATFSQRID